MNWANQELLGRLKDMASDVSDGDRVTRYASVAHEQSLVDPKVKKRLILVFHAWSIQYKACIADCSLRLNANLPG